MEAHLVESIIPLLSFSTGRQLKSTPNQENQVGN